MANSNLSYRCCPFRSFSSDMSPWQPTADEVMKSSGSWVRDCHFLNINKHTNMGLPLVSSTLADKSGPGALWSSICVTCFVGHTDLRQ